MDESPDHGRVTAPARDVAGFVTVQHVAVVALSLVVFVAMANLVVFQYGRGVVRAALDEGVRAGAHASASAAECEARAADVLADLLGGPMGSGVTIGCGEAGGEIRAAAEVRFTGWLPGVPDWSFTVDAASLKERAP